MSSYRLAEVIEDVLVVVLEVALAARAHALKTRALKRTEV